MRQRLDAPALFEVLASDRVFYDRSGGGVTFSGGEPLLQTLFLREILELCKENHLHTAVDTAGDVPFSRFAQILPVTDLLLYDIKHLDPAKHETYTGRSPVRILHNLQKLSEAGATLWIRTPVIPSFNDREEDIAAIAAFLRPLRGIARWELLPFHGMAGHKYQSLGRIYPFEDVQPPAAEQMERLRETASAVVPFVYREESNRMF